MPYTPNYQVLKTVLHNYRIARPNYDVDATGREIAENDVDHKPYGWHKCKPLHCLACDRCYPFGPLCGYCWALVKQMGKLTPA